MATPIDDALTDYAKARVKVARISARVDAATADLRVARRELVDAERVWNDTFAAAMKDAESKA